LPVAVTRAVAVAGGGRVLVLGGLGPGDVTTGRVVSLHPFGSLAHLVGSLREPVHDASGAWLRGRAVVFGGGSSTEVADAQAWSSGGGRVVGRLPSGRSDSAAAVLDGTAYVVGGYDGSALVRRVVATRDGSSFDRVARLRVPVRYPAVAAAGGAVWVLGGDLATSTGSAGGPQTDAIQRLDPSTGRVTVVGRLPHAMGHAAAFVLGGQLFIAGGRVGTGPSNRIWRVDTRTGRVTPAGRLPAAASDMAAVAVGGRVLLIGGETSGPAAPLRSIVAVTIAHMRR
jgi:hypothetical protein